MNTNLYTICNSLESQINLFETAGQVSDHFRALALMSSLPKVDWLLCDLPLGDAAGLYSRNLRRVFCEFGGVINCFRSTLSISDRLYKAGALDKIISATLSRLFWRFSMPQLYFRIPRTVHHHG